MDLDLFHKVIDDLGDFENKIKSISLHKDGEPFLNKNLGKMISYAKSKNVAYSIRTVTNGSLITKNRAREVIEAGLDGIKVSIEHVHNEGYKKITKTYARKIGWISTRLDRPFLYDH